MSVGMTIYELKQYNEERKPTEISFFSEEQSWTELSDPLMVKIIFNRMTVIQNPKQIYFTNGITQFRIGRINRIEIDSISCRDCCIGDILTIFSRDRFGKEVPIKLLIS